MSRGKGEGIHGIALFGRQRVGYLCRERVLSVQVNPEKAFRPHGPESGRYDGAPITALSGPVRIAKTLHEFHPRSCDTGNSPPCFGRLLGEPKPGQRRHDDVK